MTQKYGAQGDGYILTPEQIEQFHHDGYVTLTSVMSDQELAHIDPIFESFIRGEVPDMGRDFCDMSGPYDRKFEEFSLVNAVVPRRYKPEIKGNLFELRSASVARQLVGDAATRTTISSRQSVPTSPTQFSPGIRISAIGRPARPNR